MASLSRSSGGTYNLAFRYRGKQFLRSLETTSPQEARQKKALVERTLTHLKDGVLTFRDRATADQLWQFLRSGGQNTDLPVVLESVSLAKVCERYLESFSDGVKEATTLDTERCHLNHFKRIFSKGTVFDAIDASAVRNYIKVREKAKGNHGRCVRPDTIRKELQTLRQVWEFAKSEGYVVGENPVNGVKRPRKSEKPPFMAWEEIETRIQRGGLSHSEIAELWDCLFLREDEIAGFLDHVKSVALASSRFPYVHAALSFCAYTGARRSEMFRCHVDDVNSKVLLREKKKTQDRRITFREVPLHPELAEILDAWLIHHPGGQFLFCKNNENQLDDKTSREAFEAVTKNSDWRVLRGYHVLRHSFASNLARHGVDQYKIDEMMGHQTEEMRRRYRHLLPEDRASAIQVLSFRKS